MARINIEDDLFKRGDWMNFLILCGDQDKALGAFVRACMVAQKYWFPCRERIPRSAWDSEGLSSHLLTSKLADENENGILLKGTEKAFAWLFEMSDKGKKGGQKSAEARKKKKGGKSATTGQPQVNLGQAEVNLSEPSLLSTLTPYSLLSTQDSNSSSLVVTQKTKRFVAGYVDRFRLKYGADPIIDGRGAGIAKRVCKAISDEKIDVYLDAYFSMPDAWLHKIKHPITAFESKLNEVAVYAGTGAFTTQAQVNAADKAVNVAKLSSEAKAGGF